ncbi:MAG: uroporphyrinogen-III synthase, partial [Gemmatimonadota bacterium]
MAAPGVVVTRDEGQNGPLGRLLRERGFRVHYWPTIRIAPPADPGPLEAALAELGSFDWAVFTSPRAVAAVVERLSATGTGRAPAHAVGAGDPSARAIGETSGAGAGLRVAAVGESTA